MWVGLRYLEKWNARYWNVEKNVCAALVHCSVRYTYQCQREEKK
jgi:hypothetical protein